MWLWHEGHGEEVVLGVQSLVLGVGSWDHVECDDDTLSAQVTLLSQSGCD